MKNNLLFILALGDALLGCLYLLSGHFGSAILLFSCAFLVSLGIKEEGNEKTEEQE